MIELDTQRNPPLCRLLICNGGVCGSNKDIPLQFLEDTWKEEGLHSAVAMKICGCQDACEHASVARIITAYGTEWFENLQKEHYQALLDWARDCRKADAVVSRPEILQKLRFKGHIRDRS
ncbi:(2Fe-2S) ferredoxin domain-containing protein [Candidatus Peribacteria bacterium]|nr:(2Fe-2S) ferredoxin domain-containing protein [Candidatus Peribacteria bacterium]